MAELRLLDRLGRLPPWVQTLGWVVISLLVAVLLALVSTDYHLTNRSDPADDQAPVQLGPISLLLQGADAPAQTPAQMLARTDWRPAPKPISLGWRSEVLWARMALHNTSPVDQAVMLEVTPARLTHVRLHSPGAGGQWESRTSGAAMRSEDRPANLADLAFPLTLAPGEQRTVLVEVWSRTTSLNMSFAVFPSVVYTGMAVRTNILNVLFAGALLVLGGASLVLGISLRELPLLMLSGRIVAVGVWQLFQAGIWALMLSAGAMVSLADNIWWVAAATMSFNAAFSWSFLARAGMARPVHLFFAVMTVVSPGLLVLVALGWLPGLEYPQLSTRMSGLLLTGTALLCVRLVYRGYLPAVAVLIGSITSVAVNAPFYLLMLGWSSGAVARFFVSPIPPLITSTVLFLGAALHVVSARRKADLALKHAQQQAVARLEQEVAQRTAELVTARDEAERANRAKSVFLAKVSHELRTPMHAALGYIDLALRAQITPAPAAQKVLAARLAGQQLVGQINDLLDYARMEHEQLRLEPGSTALPALALRLKERTLLLAAERGNQFELVLAPGLPPWVWADANRLEQVLMVLLNNAVRYTRGGRITLRIGWQPPLPDTAAGTEPAPGLQAGTVRASAVPAGEVALRFEVQDTGRGIAPPALARIFQAFERGDSVDGDGMGLGLPIAQQLLALMGSRLEVSSEPGQGSQFGFALQVPLADELPAVLMPHAPLVTGYAGHTRQVLVLDDNQANRRYLEELLGDLGFGVCLFPTVSAAIAWLQGLEPGASLDLCIIDQRLEGSTTGWDFVRALRTAQTIPQAVRPCPVLMLSATEPLPPPGWTLPRGVDRHLLKPADPQRLLQAVGDLAGVVWTALPAAVLPPAGSPVAPAAGLTPAQAWQALAALASRGDLTALDDWVQANLVAPGQDAVLPRLVQALDFAAIEEHARNQLADLADLAV